MAVNEKRQHQPKVMLFEDNAKWVDLHIHENCSSVQGNLDTSDFSHFAILLGFQILYFFKYLE